MKPLKPAPPNWHIPRSRRCVYQKQVLPGRMIRCRYRKVPYTKYGFNGFCGIHKRMMELRSKAKAEGRPYRGFVVI